MTILLTYTTLANYADTNYIIQLAKDTGDSTTPGTGGTLPWQDRVTAIIASADSDIRGALSKQYTDTEMEADESVKRACAAIVIYLLESRKGLGHTPTIAQAYADVMNKLQKIQLGTDKLQAVPQLVPFGSPSSPAKVFEQSGYFTGLAEIV
jgi:hypothetical protein